MRLFLERTFPYIAGAVIAVAAMKLPQSQLLVTVNRLVDPVINISAVLVGFLAAMLGMLLANQGNRVIKSLKTSEKYSRLFCNYIRESFDLCFVLLILSATMLFVQRLISSRVLLLVSYLWMFLLASAVFAAYRVTRLLWIIVRSEFRTGKEADDGQEEQAPSASA